MLRLRRWQAEHHQVWRYVLWSATHGKRCAPCLIACTQLGPNP
ncbi:hypothetical protein XOCgx_1414 [Xanthomonas oryzae pv. oryzicola]|nr:hypothetical protein XOCgx_1414 [Xanthomonas oryzae pv. oryzicola]